MNFSFAEFWRCSKAIFGFAAGYKKGEGYALGDLEETEGKAADPEAWQAGYDMAHKRSAYRSAVTAAVTVTHAHAAEASAVDPLDVTGPDGLTDRQRAIDPNPAHWTHDPDTDPQGPPTDDSKDTRIP